MIKFRTEVELPDFENKLGYRRQSMMIGSCFAGNIGNYLRDYCFPIVVNPFGILYNPISIANCLDFLLTGKKFTEHDLFFSNGLFNSFSHHGQFSGTDLNKTLQRMNSSAAEAFEVLKNCSHLFITFGTSWVFEHKATGNVVSNCHKLPASTFRHYRLSIEETTAVWVSLIEKLHQVNPDLQLVFTVSPIRHLKDGAHENQLSKSILLMVIEFLQSRFGNELVNYFPAYELVMDELRDYRFYATDMIHPAEVAVDFILEKFIVATLDAESRGVITDFAKILQALKHRVLDNSNMGYKAFILNQIEKANQLQVKYPFVDFKVVIEKLYEKISD